MSIAFRITLIIVSVFTLLYMCKKVKQEKLQIEYSIFWTLFAIMLVLFSIFPQIADWMSELVGVYSTTNFIFLFSGSLLQYIPVCAVHLHQTVLRNHIPFDMHISYQSEIHLQVLNLPEDL